jgi:ATP:ADP antiporter, AAA family
MSRPASAIDVPRAQALGLLDRALSLFGAVEPGESATVLLLLSNLFLLLVGYYVVKTVREPLILASGGAEMKSYAAGAQAVALTGFVPLYGWLSSRIDRARLIVAVLLFFAATLEVFHVLAVARMPYLGFAFFVWVGVFSLSTVALFWSYANDIYPRSTGERLFPVIAIGATLGSPVGSLLAEKLFEAGVSPYDMMHVAAVLLLLHLALYRAIDRRESRRRRAAAAPPLARGPGGFALVLRSPYLRLLAALLVLINVVNTTGEYVLGSSVLKAARAAAAASPGLNVEAFIGRFYGSYFLWVNVASVLLQALLVSRVVKYAGMRGVLFALPAVALGAYGVIAAGAGLAAIRWTKTAENATDYSFMNTGKQMLWLPTSREEKYKAKQAIDTFFYRAGDVLAAGLVYAGTTWAGFDSRDFARANLAVVLVWWFVVWRLLKFYRTLCASCP